MKGSSQQAILGANRKGPFKKRILPDFWFLTADKRSDGRSGHMYTCPIVMTISMYILRIKMRKTHSVNWERSESWFHDDDRYESARIIARPFGRNGGYSIPCVFPVWTIKLECWLSHKYMYWQWRKQLKKERS